jgi:retron-type reverse transcriptase
MRLSERGCPALLTSRRPSPPAPAGGGRFQSKRGVAFIRNRGSVSTEISTKAAPGVDGVTWGAYGQDLEANLRDLHQRLHNGRYRARPSRRAYIPKADGRLRPLGIATLEDKILQRAVVEVLNAIYEVDFLGFSYGFRPGPQPA